MKKFEVDENELEVVYKGGEKKAVIIKYDTFIKMLQNLKERERKEPVDLLSPVIGICEGPPDLAESHDRYVYTSK